MQRDVELDVILLIYWEYKPIININTSIGQGEQSQGRVLEVYGGERGVSCVLWKERKRRKVWKRY